MVVFFGDLFVVLFGNLFVVLFSDLLSTLAPLNSVCFDVEFNDVFRRHLTASNTQFYNKK
jgi:hypothetical protein